MIEWHDLVLGYGKDILLKSGGGGIGGGSFTCLMGKNGCGKSTLLHVLSGIARPLGGTVLAGGVNIHSLPASERARLTSYFPQTRPVPQMEALQMIQHGRFPHLGFSKTLRPQDHRAVDRAIALTNTEGLLHKSLSNLSGGERQRVYLAMMIAQDAQIMLLDEPATFLDIDYQITLLNVIRQLHREGKTVVMVAHDLVQSAACATDICLIKNNGSLLCESKQCMINSPHICRTFGVSVAEDAQGGLFGYRLVKGDPHEDDYPRGL